MSVESPPAEPLLYSSPAPSHYVIATLYITRNDSSSQSESPIEEEPSGQYLTHVLAPGVAIVGSACVIVILAFIISRLRRSARAKYEADLDKEAYINEGFTENAQDSCKKQDPMAPVFTISEPDVFQPLPPKFKYKNNLTVSERIISVFTKPKPLDSTITDERVRNQLKSIYVY